MIKKQIIVARPDGDITVNIWTDVVEEKALQQLENTARMPFVAKMSVMPDVHFGMGATIGSVIATKNALMPAASSLNCFIFSNTATPKGEWGSTSAPPFFITDFFRLISYKGKAYMKAYLQ